MHPMQCYKQNTPDLNMVYVKLAIVVENDPKDPFSIATTPKNWMFWNE